jgi:hypothetical protein
MLSTQLSTGSQTEGHLESEDIVGLVQRVLRDGPFSMRQFADDADPKYDVLRGWAIGRRTPTAENLSRMAYGFEEPAHKLLRIADELREAANERS